jgi:hypothetical protein
MEAGFLRVLSAFGAHLQDFVRYQTGLKYGFVFEARGDFSAATACFSLLQLRCIQGGGCDRTTGVSPCVDAALVEFDGERLAESTE